jgi:hypothetical protein
VGRAAAEEKRVGGASSADWETVAVAAAGSNNRGSSLHSDNHTLPATTHHPNNVKCFRVMRCCSNLDKTQLQSPLTRPAMGHHPNNMNAVESCGVLS